MEDAELKDLARKLLHMEDAELMRHFVRGCFAFACTEKCWRVTGYKTGESWLNDDLTK